MQIQSPRQSLLLAVLLGFTLLACHQADHPANAPVSRRKALIAALKALRGRMLSGDKEQIAGIFTFPLADSVFNIYVNDSVFQDEYAKHGNALTRQMFDTYFNEIGSGPGDFVALFSFLNPDSLLTRDTIEHDDIVDTLPYYTNYSITIDRDSLVWIRFNTGPNSSYVAPKNARDSANSPRDTASARVDGASARVDGASAKLDGASDRTDGASGSVDSASFPDGDDDPSQYEHDIGWEFVFDGKKLRFQREYQAD